MKRNRWDHDKLIDNPVFNDGELPSDALRDFYTLNCTLSLWITGKSEGELTRMIANLACGRDQIENFDFVMFKECLLMDYNKNLQRTKGKAFDEEIAQNHFNLVEISGKMLAEICKEVFYKGDVKRIMPQEVASYIKNSIDSGYIEESALKKKIIEGIDKYSQ